MAEKSNVMTYYTGMHDPCFSSFLKISYYSRLRGGSGLGRCSSLARAPQPFTPGVQWLEVVGDGFPKSVKLNVPQLADITHNHRLGSHDPRILSKCMSLPHGTSGTYTEHETVLRHFRCVRRPHDTH